jgi:hypothetical protein
MGDLFGKIMIGFFQLITSGFTSRKSSLEVVAFNSAGVKLDIEIIDSGVGMSKLVGEVTVGIFKLSTSGFTSRKGSL